MSGFMTGDEPVSEAVVPKNPNLQPEKYQGVAVDSKYIPRKMLLTHVSGYLWVADSYFSQYIAKDDELASNEVNRPGVYQQYLRIRGLELRVQNPLDTSQDSGSKEFSVTGSATLYSTMVPNKGDAFIADVGDGRAGIFNVTNATQNSILLDTTYSIEYELVAFSNDNTRMQDLLDKTVKTVYYHKDFMAMGKDPFLVSEEHQAVLEFGKQLARLPGEYYKEFFNNQYKTFVVPGQKQIVYDPFLTKHVWATTSLDDTYLHLELKVHNVQDGINDLKSTLWDAIRNRDYMLVDLITPIMTHYMPDTSYQTVAYSSWRLSGMAFLYFHKGVKTSIAMEVPAKGKLTECPMPEFNRPIDIFALIPEDQLQGLPMAHKRPMALIHPVADDEYYVLSKAFYQENWSEMSILEVLVYCYLQSKPIPLVPLQKLLAQVHYWPALERFYYIPILIVLLKDCFKDVN